MNYLKVWVSFREALTPFSDAEKGRLFDAMLAYAADGEEPHFSGNERFIWATVKQNIDMTRETSEKRKVSGSRNGDTTPEANYSKPEKTIENDSKEEQPEANAPYKEKKRKDNNKENENDKSRTIVPLKRFSPPSLEDIQDYCLERRNHVDPEKFFDYYTSNGWKVGKNQMKDWRATVRRWERSEITEQEYNREREFSPLPY